VTPQSPLQNSNAAVHSWARAGPKCAIPYTMIGIEMQKGYFWGARDHADEIDALYCMQKHLLQPNLALGIFRYHLVFLKPKRAENTKWDFSGALFLFAWLPLLLSVVVGFLLFSLLPLCTSYRRWNYSSYGMVRTFDCQTTRASMLLVVANKVTEARTSLSKERPG